MFLAFLGLPSHVHSPKQLQATEEHGTKGPGTVVFVFQSLGQFFDAWMDQQSWFVHIHTNPFCRLDGGFIKDLSL